MGAESGVWKVKSGVWRVESGKSRAEFGEWRVESEDRWVRVQHIGKWRSSTHR